MKPHGVQRDQGSPGSTLGIARRAGGGGSVFATLVPLWVRFGSQPRPRKRPLSGVKRKSISGDWTSESSQKATFALLVFEVRHIQKSEQAAQSR